MEELEEVVKELDEKVLESYYCICKYYNVKLNKDCYEKLSKKLSKIKIEQ